jgi:hypothetical protein
VFEVRIQIRTGIGVIIIIIIGVMEAKFEVNIPIGAAAVVANCSK